MYEKNNSYTFTDMKGLCISVCGVKQWNRLHGNLRIFQTWGSLKSLTKIKFLRSTARHLLRIQAVHSLYLFFLWLLLLSCHKLLLFSWFFDNIQCNSIRLVVIIFLFLLSINDYLILYLFLHNLALIFFFFLQVGFNKFCFFSFLFGYAIYVNIIYYDYYSLGF